MNCEFCFSFFSPFLFFSFLFPFTSFLREPRASRERAPEEKKRQGEGTSQKKSFRIIYKCMTEEEFKAKKKIERKKERKKHDTKRTSSIVSHWNCNHHVLLLSFSFSVSLYYYVGGGGGGGRKEERRGFPTSFGSEMRVPQLTTKSRIGKIQEMIRCGRGCVESFRDRQTERRRKRSKC